MKAHIRLIGAGVVVGAVFASLAWGQQGDHSMPHGQMMQAPGHGTAQRPGQAGHEGHGTPEGWKFTLPKGGDPEKGREVFVKFECFACHEVKGEKFPAPDPGKVGPELSAMAAAHSPEYFAEAIINPNALIEKGRGYEAPDGSSKMPTFNDDLTVRDVVDLVAYLLNLKPPAAGAPAPGSPPPAGHGGH